MAIPGDTPRPRNRRSRATPWSTAREISSIFIELTGDQIGERRHRRFGLASGGGQLDDRARRRLQQQQFQDLVAGDRGPVLAHPHLGVKEPDHFDELGGGAGVEALLVADRHDRARCSIVRRRFRTGRLVGGRRTHRRASLSSCEATLMYLRPASWAPSTVRSRLSVWRKLASLISIGRLTPAMTSILPRSMTEIARFEGVPPNMSVNNTAPSPLSTSAIERRISWRRCSMSSSGPMHTAAIWACGPTTCSRAAANSAASRP